MASAVALAAMLSAVVPSQSAQAETPDPDRAQQNLQATEQDLQSSSARQQQLTAELTAAIAAHNQISDQLITAAREITSRENALLATEDKVRQLDSEKKSIQAELAAKQDVLSELLAGLQRLEQNPPPALVVEPHDILDALRGAMMFGAVVPAMRDQAELLLNKLERLAAVRKEIDIQREAVKTQIASLQQAHGNLTSLLETKQQLIKTSDASLQAEQKRAGELVKKAKNLQQLLAAIQADQAKIEARKTAEAKAREEEQKRLEASLARPPMQLSAARGRLEYPVQGAIIGNFGGDTGLGSTLSGVAIATRTGLQVRAPVDGKVEFAGPFRSYGQLLILNAGEGYLVLMAGMQAISTSIGQTIRAGEPVGLMGKGPSTVALLERNSADDRPVLYVEFRKNGEPVDPQPWWIGSRKEAMQ